VSKKKKPAPISMKLHRAAPEVLAPDIALAPFNEVSSVTAKQMARAELGIDALRQEVKELRSTRGTEVATHAPVINIPPRARIAKVTIRYDQLGFPTELIPQYSEPAV
jgi:hypothetical protein